MYEFWGRQFNPYSVPAVRTYVAGNLFRLGGQAREDQHGACTTPSGAPLTSAHRKCPCSLGDHPHLQPWSFLEKDLHLGASLSSPRVLEKSLLFSKSGEVATATTESQGPWPFPCPALPWWDVTEQTILGAPRLLTHFKPLPPLRFSFPSLVDAPVPTHQLLRHSTVDSFILFSVSLPHCSVSSMRIEIFIFYVCCWIPNTPECLELSRGSINTW